MKKIIFFLVIFAAQNAYTFSLGSMSIPVAIAKVESNPGLQSNQIKKGSARNMGELGNIQESAEKANQPDKINSLRNQRKDNIKTSSISSVSCRTYEGEEFQSGEAGYNDCIRKIKNDRQGTPPAP
jgi:hypothetical protein